MKEGLIALLGAPKKGDAKAEPDADDPADDSEVGLDAAADEILAAVKADDAAALKVALKSFYEQC